MFGLFQQTLISSASFFVVYVLFAQGGNRGSRYADQTDIVKSRLSPEVAQLLSDSHVRILRISRQNSLMIAETRLGFPRSPIFIDYSHERISGVQEDFIIAHEIAHVRGHHVLVKILNQSIVPGFFTALALTLTVGEHSIVKACAIALPILIFSEILVFLPLDLVLTWLTEYEADKFAVKYVGKRNALDALEALKSLFPSSRAMLQKNLDDRIGRISK